MTVSGMAQIKFDIGNVRELDLTDKLNVVLIPSNENYVNVEGDLVDKVEIIQKENKLRIKMASGYPLKGANTFIKIYSPNISNFIVQKGAIVQTDTEQLVVDSLVIWANEGAKLDLQVQSKNVEVNSTTGSSVELNGQTEAQTINLTFGGNFYGEKLESKHAVARINGGGVCDVRSSISADVQTRAGGVITIYGNPAERRQRRLAGGKITFID